MGRSPLASRSLEEYDAGKVQCLDLKGSTSMHPRRKDPSAPIGMLRRQSLEKWLGLGLMLLLLAGCSGKDKLEENFAQPAIPGKGWGPLVIGETTIKDLTEVFGLTLANPQSDLNGNEIDPGGDLNAQIQQLSGRTVVRVRHPKTKIVMDFVAHDGKTLVAASDKEYLSFGGKLQCISFSFTNTPLVRTDKGLELLDSRERVEELLGPPDGHYDGMWGKSQDFFNGGVVLDLAHPDGLKGLKLGTAEKVPETYKEVAALHQEKIAKAVTDESPSAGCVYAMYIVEPFEVKGIRWARMQDRIKTTLLSQPDLPASTPWPSSP